MRIKVAIPEIIDSAACAAHDESAGKEESRGADDCGGCGDRDSHCSGKECAEKAGEEEVVGPCRLVQTHEFGVRDSFLGKVGKEAGCWGDICWRDWCVLGCHCRHVGV